jgi:hypothetical protein
VPLGLQHLLNFVRFEGAPFGMPINFRYIGSLSDEILNSTAAQQLLIEHVSTKSSSGTYRTYDEHSERTTFLSDLANLGNYPVYCKKVAMSDGALNGEAQHNIYDFTQRTANDKIFDVYAELYASILWFIQVPIMDYDLEVFTNPSGNGLVFYSDFRTWDIDIDLYWIGVTLNLSYQSVVGQTEQVNSNPYCIYPGGYFFADGFEEVVGNSTDDNKSFNLGHNFFTNLFAYKTGSTSTGCWGGDAHLGWEGLNSLNVELDVCSQGAHFCFVPLQSALDWSTPGTYAWNDDIESEIEGDRTLLNTETPFDVIVANGVGDYGEHLFLDALNRRHPLIKYSGRDAVLDDLYPYRDCSSSIFGHWINLEAGDERFFLDNYVCSRDGVYEGEYELHANTFGNPDYSYVGGGTGRLPGFYSKSGFFSVLDNVNADFRYDFATHNPPTVINYSFTPAPYQGTTPYDGSWSETNSAWLACSTCVDFASFAMPVPNKQTYTHNRGTTISMFPNPVSDGRIWVTYDPSDQPSAMLTVTDLLGRVRFEKYIRHAKGGLKVTTVTNLAEAGLSEGVYFVTLMNGTERYTQKIVLR